MASRISVSGPNTRPSSKKCRQRRPEPLAFVFNEDEFDGAGGSGTLNIISGVPTGGTTTAVPEPSSLALIMVVGGFLVTRRQRVSV